MNQKLEKQFEIAKDYLNPNSMRLDTLNEFYKLLFLFYNYLEGKMDKKIRKIEKEVEEVSKAHHTKHNEKKMDMDLEKVDKNLKQLEKMDKKRDKFVSAGKKAMKKKK